MMAWPDAELGPHRGPVPALGVAVDDVVVEEGEVVHELDGDGADRPDAARSAPAAAAEQQHQPGADELASPGEVMAHSGAEAPG